MKFSLSELEELFKRINEIIEYIEETGFANRRLKLFLSNGEALNFSLQNKFIPHLLGIDTNYLNSTSIFKSKSSFDLLKEFTESAYKIHNLSNNGIINYDCLFSKYILSKVENFKENIMLDTREVEFVCKYDKARTYGTDLIEYDCDYFIFKRLNNEKYGLLSLVNNDGYYVPMSSQIYNSYDEVMKKLELLTKFQEITLLNGVKLTNITQIDFSKEFHLKLDDKKTKIEKLKVYKNRFNCSIDITSDSTFTMDKFQKNYGDKDEIYRLVEIISKCISEGKIIATSEIGNTTLLPIITAFNDFLYSNEYEATESNGNTYTSLIENLNTFKRRVQELEKENSELSTNYKSLCEENNRLSSENAKLNKAQDEIFEIVKKAR